MTHNQISHAQNVEQQRANRSKERLTQKDLTERTRANRAAEKQKKSELDWKKGQYFIDKGLNTVDNAMKSKSINLGNLMSVLSKANDPAWYNYDKQLLNDVAKISFDQPLGTPVPNNTTVNPTSATNKEYMNIPGIMGLPYYATIGTNDVSLAAAKAIYSYVRHANSGSANYESGDLMLYLIAVDSVYSMIAWGARMYSFMVHSDNFNRYTWQAIFKAATGYNDSDDWEALAWQSDIAQFRAGLNRCISLANSLNVPNIMSMYDRHAWLNSNVFKDADIRRASLYIFAPEVVYSYEATRGYLNPLRFYGNSNIMATPNLFITQLSNIISLLLADEDIGIMSGDILKAYGGDKLYRVQQIPEGFEIPFVYSQEVLNQIASATVAPGGIYLGSVGIGQHNGFPTQGVISDSNVTGVYDITPNTAFQFGTDASAAVINAESTTALINLGWDDPTPDDVMVCTRLTASYSTVRMTSYGTEFIGEVVITSITTPQDMTPNSNPYPMSSFYGIYRPSRTSTDTLNYVKYSKFDWAPYLTIFDTTGSTASVVNYGVLGDVSNFATVSQRVLNSMHYVAVMSEMGVPQSIDMIGQSRR